MTCVEIMLELVRSAVFERTPRIPDSVGINWDELLDCASKEGLIGWTWDGICKLPSRQQPPRVQRLNWSLSAQEIIDRYHQQKNVLEQLITVCNQNGMRLLLLKGIGLSILYPKPELRPSGDIDIYLFEDYERGNLLFSQSDSEFRHKHTAFDYLGVHIENHQTPLDTDTSHRKKVEAYIESKLDLCAQTDDGYYVMDPMTNLVYIVMHSIRHFEANANIPLKNVVDIVLFIIEHRSILDAKSCLAVFRYLNMGKQFELIIIMAEYISGIDLSGFRYGVVTEKEQSLLLSKLINGGLGNPIPKVMPLNHENVMLWKQYISVVCLYKTFADPEVDYCKEVLRHIGGVLLKRLLKKNECDPLFNVVL